MCTVERLSLQVSAVGEQEHAHAFVTGVSFCPRGREVPAQQEHGGRVGHPRCSFRSDYGSAPCVGLLSDVTCRMHLKGRRRPTSLLAFGHLGTFKTINLILLLVTHKIVHWLWSWFTQIVPQRWDFCLSYGSFFFHPTVFTSKDLNLEVFVGKVLAFTILKI